MKNLFINYNNHPNTQLMVTQSGLDVNSNGGIPAYPTMSIEKWLDQHPQPEEIATNEDGSEYLPIGIVEQLLDDATGKTWGHRNFQINCHSDNGFISASLELLFLDRVVVGGITFHETEYPGNHDWAGISISECTKNAAKKLGNRFGRSLNGRNDRSQKLPKNVKESVKTKPDAATMQKYLYAVSIGDSLTIDKLVGIYDIKVG